MKKKIYPSIFRNQLKKITLAFFMLASLGFVQRSFGQVQLIPASDGSFENASTTFTDNGWTTVQGADNRIWRVGTPAGSNTGVNAAYTGTAANYNGLNLARVNHFYRDVAIPAGATNVMLSFYYRQPNVDDTYDFFYASTTDVGTTPQQDVVPGAGFNVLFSNTANAYAGFTLVGPFDLTALAGTTVRIVFSAEADGVAPAANPAVDDITLSYIPSGYNMGVSAITAPVIPACYTSNETVTVTVENDGNMDLDLSVTPLTVNASVTGPNPVSFAPVVLSSGIFAAGTTQSVTVGTAYDMSATGTYVISATTSVANDADAGNDTFSNSYEKLDNPSVSVTSSTPAFCEGGSTQLTASVAVIPPPVSYSNNNDYGIPDSNPAGINSTIVSSFAGPANSILSCTVNINHTYVGDLVLTLIAPDGSSVVLANQVGAAGANYTGTIFSDAAVTPIGNGTAPFTGLFNPEQAFSNLTGSAAGTWTLNVSDNAFLDTGTILDWSLSLPSSGSISGYSWSPAAGLSSTTLPDPMANPGSTTTYTVTVTNYAGCTGTATSTVTVHPLYNMNQNITLCAGDSIVIGGNVYNSNGVYTDVLQSMFGCDSTVVTNLNVNLPILAAQTLTICSGDSIVIGGNTYNGTGIYTDVLVASNGCDSTLVTDLTVLPVAQVNQSFTLCQGNSVTVGSNTYNATGIFNDVFVAANGCDSIVTTDLTIIPAVPNNQTFQICSGDSVMVGNNSYDSTGVYTDIFPGTGGCDSLVVTTLTVYPAIQFSQQFTICSGDSVVVGNNIYTSSGNYTDILTSFSGCDSTVNTQLTVLPVIPSSQSFAICAGDSVVVGNSVYFTSGIFTDIFPSANGCDSVVTTNLTVSNPISFSQSLAICAGGSVNVGTNTYTVAGVYTDVLVASGGCDSTVTTTLTVNALPNVALAAFTDPFCLQTANYVLSGGSPAGGTYIGAGITNSPNFSPVAAGTGTHAITYSYTDANNCTAQATQSLIVTDCTGLEEKALQQKVMVYPNPSQGQFTLNIGDAGNSRIAITVLDYNGKEILSVSESSSSQSYKKEINLDGVARGIYLVRVMVDDETATLKLMVD